jgi:hypothetical protein
MAPTAIEPTLGHPTYGECAGPKSTGSRHQTFQFEDWIKRVARQKRYNSHRKFSRPDRDGVGLIEGFEQPRRNAREIFRRVAGLQISL